MKLNKLSEKYLQILIIIFSLLGVAVATYLIIETTNGTLQCGLGGCETVQKSKYAELFGQNISWYGLAGYIGILVTAALRKDIFRIVGFGATLFGFGISLYLTYLEIFVIKAICQYCVASAIIMTILFALATLRVFLYYGFNESYKSDSDVP